MTKHSIAQRLERIEAKQNIGVRVVVCWCPADEKHRPDCEAAGAGDNDRVIRVTWGEDHDN